MKFRRDKAVLLFLVMGLCVVFLGAIMFAFFHMGAGMGFIIGGIVLLLSGLRFATKPKEYFLQDERDVRINEKAGYYALWAVMTVNSIMYLLKVTELWDADFMDAYSMVLFIGIYGWIILRWYFNRVGDTG